MRYGLLLLLACATVAAAQPVGVDPRSAAEIAAAQTAVQDMAARVTQTRATLEAQLAEQQRAQQRVRQLVVDEATRLGLDPAKVEFDFATGTFRSKP